MAKGNAALVGVSAIAVAAVTLRGPDRTTAVIAEPMLAGRQQMTALVRSPLPAELVENDAISANSDEQREWIINFGEVRCDDGTQLGLTDLEAGMVIEYDMVGDDVLASMPPQIAVTNLTVRC